MKTNPDAARGPVNDALAANHVVLANDGRAAVEQIFVGSLRSFLDEQGRKHAKVDLWGDPTLHHVHDFVLDEAIPLVADVLRAMSGTLPLDSGARATPTPPMNGKHVHAAARAVFASTLVRTRCQGVLDIFAQAIGAKEKGLGVDVGQPAIDKTAICRDYNVVG